MKLFRGADWIWDCEAGDRVGVGIYMGESGIAWLTANGRVVVGITPDGKIVRALDHKGHLRAMGFRINPLGYVIENKSYDE